MLCFTRDEFYAATDRVIPVSIPTVGTMILTRDDMMSNGGFESGALGYNASGAIPSIIDGKPVVFRVSCSIVVQDSKDDTVAARVKATKAAKAARRK